MSVGSFNQYERSLLHRFMNSYAFLYGKGKRVQLRIQFMDMALAKSYSESGVKPCYVWSWSSGPVYLGLSMTHQRKKETPP